MAGIREWLSGKKTFLVAGAAILTAVAAWADGTASLFQAIQMILAALGAVTMRAAIAKS